MPATRSPDFVQSLQRGLSVIRAFDAGHRALTLSEVARETGLTRAAARRFLITLQQLEYVSYNGSRFSLRPRVLELGFAYLSSLSLPDVARPHVDALVAELGESSSVTVLDEADVVYVVRVPVRRIMSVAIAVGSRFPAYATSMGRVLLAGLDPADLDDRLARTELRPITPRTIVDERALRAELEQVREQGFAIVDEELEEGLRSAAVPIRDASGDVVAAQNVSTNAGRVSVATMRREHVPALLRSAAAIEADLRACRPAA